MATLLGEGTALAACQPPEHRVIQSFISRGAGLARVVVARQEYDVSNVVCLAETLRAWHPEWKHAVILFFTSEEAAAWFCPACMSISDFAPQDPTGSRTFESELRALYTLDIRKPESQLTITPLGFGHDVRYDTDVTLPSTTPVSCTLALGQRCVLALHPLPVAGEAWRAGATGSVTLSAAVSADGTVSGIEVIGVTSVTPEWSERFRSASIANLQTWWLERGERPERMAVTFDYTFEQPVPRDSRTADALMRITMPRIDVRSDAPK